MSYESGVPRIAFEHQSVGAGNQRLRIDFDRLANQIHGHVVAAYLVGDNAEQVQRVRMFWLRRENLTVERLRGRQLSGTENSRDRPHLYAEQGFRRSRLGSNRSGSR